MDALDARLIRVLDADARIGVLELSRRLHIARATVQARLDKLQYRGIIEGFIPWLNVGAMGYVVTAFTTMEIRQGRGPDVIEHLRGVPEVLEVHTITGHGDLLCRIVARSNADLQRVIDLAVLEDAIVRTETIIALSERIPYRTSQLLTDAAIDRPSAGTSVRESTGSGADLD